MVGRAEVLACVFFLLSLLCYMTAVSSGSGQTLTAIAHTKWPFVLLSVVMSGLSLLSKEQGVTVVGVCATFDVFLNWEHIWSSVKNRRHSRDTALEQKTSIPEVNRGSTNHVTSIKTMSSGLHINGISNKPPSTKKGNKFSGVSTGSLAQRIGMHDFHC